MTAVFYTIALTYALIVGVIYRYQRQLLYHPDAVVEAPERYGLQGFKEYFIPSSGGVTVQLWYRPAATGMPTIVYYHGNAGNIGGRAGIYGALAEKGFGVLALSYRGYGKSTGTPTEHGIYDDARASLRFLSGDQHIPFNRIILFGESLGTGVAVQMATEHDVSCLVLEAPFTSVEARAAEIYYYLPVRVMIKDKFDSLSKIKKVHVPLLLFHGVLDATVPIAMGKKLFAAANEPKQAFYFSHTAHNDFDSHVLAQHVWQFAKKNNLITTL